jgi:hypothetical protein
MVEECIWLRVIYVDMETDIDMRHAASGWLLPKEMDFTTR